MEPSETVAKSDDAQSTDDPADADAAADLGAETEAAKTAPTDDAPVMNGTMDAVPADISTAQDRG